MKQITFTLTRPPGSAKNRREPIVVSSKKTGKQRVIYRPNHEARVDKGIINALVLAEEERWEGVDVAITLVYHVRTETCDVTIENLGDPPVKRGERTGRRRDLHGMIELLADALQDEPRSGQRGVIKNDNQIARVTLIRSYD